MKIKNFEGGERNFLSFDKKSSERKEKEDAR